METHTLFTINSLANKLKMDRATIVRILRDTPADGKTDRGWDGYYLTTFEVALDQYNKTKKKKVLEDGENAGNKLMEQEIEKNEEMIEKLRLQNAEARKELVNSKEVLKYMVVWKSLITSGIKSILLTTIPSKGAGLNPEKLRSLGEDCYNEIVGQFEKGTTEWIVLKEIPKVEVEGILEEAQEELDHRQMEFEI